MLVYDPVATRYPAAQQVWHPLDSLRGKVVGFIDNSKPNFSQLADDLGELLVSK